MKVTFWRIAFFFAMLLVVANNAKGNLRIICKSNMKTSGVSISLYMTGIHFPSQEVIWSSVHLYKVKNIHLRRDHLLASVIAENIWTMLSTCYFSAGWSVPWGMKDKQPDSSTTQPLCVWRTSWLSFDLRMRGVGEPRGHPSPDLSDTLQHN